MSLKGIGADINQYQADNLLWLLKQCKNTDADTGDWLCELIDELLICGANVSGANEPDMRLVILLP